MKPCKAISLFLAFTTLFYLDAEDLSAIPEYGWGSSPSAEPQEEEASTSWFQSSKPKEKKRKPRQEKDEFVGEIGAVYLRPYQGGTDFATLVNSSDFTANNGSDQQPYGKNKALDFNFDWGVRAGIGYQGGRSKQSLKATYLYLGAKASRTTKSDFTPTGPFNQAIFVPFLEGGLSTGFGDLCQQAHSSWNLHFNMLDIVFGKRFPRKRCMSFEPFFGAKGIYYSEIQKMKFINDNNGNTGKLKQKITFEGAGVMGGLNLDWLLLDWLSLIGSIDGALLYSSIKTKRTSDEGIGSILWTGKAHDIKGTPVLEGYLALRGVYCFQKGQFVDFKIGFEEHYIFQTMKHLLLNSDSSTDLSLMGWFATFGFGF